MKSNTYAEMIDFCCDGLVLNNDITIELANKGIFFEYYCGNDYDEETDTFADIYQCYIVSEYSAERLKEYTNEIVYYYPDLNLHILGVTHVGTAWDYVSANWKEE